MKSGIYEVLDDDKEQVQEGQEEEITIREKFNKAGGKRGRKVRVK